ncbi:MAG: superoxide dismutase [Candidatus Sungbacteria bacterium RIFCSPHIGHO2_02_FULL_49_12]|uniref:superoxide dismutase n=1 Tax=Candidatus Sungbacteria bacterium RIFCSPHIGHO2_02_FULL_49_12 TaxID=1802271 RepID=A0A1G2KPN4_9BACT|nr:MAG: superoxide dismutase [Candidatus Sungbacteria bacterium RIFCSPHIGHO2_02_FULL_49_12]
MDPKPLKYASLEGLSEKQLKEHHDVLYAGYVKKTNEIREALKTADTATANATYSQLGELKREETFALNGVKLHEGYFDNMSNEKGGEPSGMVRQWIEEDFGSVAKWAEDFKATGIAARGWVILAFDLDEGKLRTYLCDSHNQGGVWNSVALLIMDVYEHAYFLDYATGRKAYIEAFMKLIDWSEVNRIAEKFGLEKFRK